MADKKATRRQRTARIAALVVACVMGLSVILRAVLK